MSTSMALFQRSTSADQLAQVLAANSTILVLAVPLGTILGGPLVTAIGAGTTLLICAFATITLGTAAAGMLAVRCARW